MNNNSVFKRDWNVTRFAPINYIVVAVIIAIGIALISIPQIGFNTGVDFSSSYTLAVNYTGDYDTQLGRIEQVLSNKVVDEEGNAYRPVKIIKHQKEGTATSGYAVRVYYKAASTKNAQDMDTLNADIVKALKSEFENDDNPDYSFGVSDTATQVSAFRSVQSILRAAAAISVALVAAMIYIAIRHNLANSLAAFAIAAVDVLLLLALMAITRATLNFAFLGVTALVICLSLINSAVILTGYKELRKNPVNKAKSTTALVNTAVKDTFMTLALMAGIVIIAAIALIVSSLLGGGSYVGLGLSVIYSAVITLATGLLVKPSVLVLFNDYNKSKKPSKSK